MKKLWAWVLLAGSAWALPVMDEGFARGQMFISAFAGFVPAGGGWDAMYNLCYESAVSRDFGVGFAYSQKQSHVGTNRDQLIFPAPEADKLTYATITTRLFCLEGKYHLDFARSRRLDFFLGAGFGLELNKDNSLVFTYADSRLLVETVDRNHYYLVANFFGGCGWYLADNLALAAKAGYQYSGMSGADAVLSAGIVFRIR
jgi:hypothetical protein